MKQYLLTLFCLCVSMIALAQQKTITGTVIDTRHEPVIGASVLEKGTSNGTITNLDGEYSLKVSPGATLVFSYIGYKTQEIRVSANTNINVTLAEDAEQLQEVDAPRDRPLVLRRRRANRQDGHRFGELGGLEG